jgi:hypothetical protein
MGMSEFYGAGDEKESIATIHRALELGVTLLDTADMYGPFTNEELVGRALAGRRDGGGARHQIRQRAGARRHSHRDQRPARVRARRVRRLPAAPGRRPHRPLLPTSRRPRHPHRGHRGCHGGAGRGGQSPTPGAVGGGTRDHSPGPRRAPDHRAADRVVAVDPRPGSGRGARHRARSRHRLRRLFAPRARLSVRRLPDARGSGARRLPSPQPPVPGGELPEEPATRRAGEGHRHRQRGGGVPAGAGLGARPGQAFLKRPWSPFSTRPETVHTTSQAAITATATAVDSGSKYDESRSPPGPFTIRS